MDYSQISIRFIAKKEPLYFIGSQLRGAFGYALKEVVCINPSRRCEGCFAANNCLYHDFYEDPAYHQYRFDFELGKSYYDFSLFLFENATEKIPYILAALHRMLTVNGLGKERFKPQTFQITLNGQNILDKDSNIKLPVQLTKRYTPPQQSSTSVTLRLITPLRIKYQNRFVRYPAQLELRTVINSIYQRQRQIKGDSFERLPFEPQGKITECFAKFKDLTRYSGRQKGHLKIGGLVGELRIEGVDDESYRLLKLAELIGIGKQTVFGLGKVEVVDTI